VTLWTLLLVLGLTLIGTRLLQRFARSLQLLDEPNHRSMHAEPVPRGGGLVFVPVAILGFALAAPELCLAHLPEMAALGVILGIGFLDDRHEAAPKMKFLVIALATLILWEAGLLIDQVGDYFGRELRFGWLALPFTFFALAGFTNAFNLIDGIDGLAGTLALLILGGLAWLGWQEGDTYLLALTLSFMAAVVGFLFFNWHPASIFMGDSGSLTLGFLIGMLSIHALAYLPSVSVLYLGAIPILDTLVAMIRRKRAGYSAMEPDRCHFHHLLLLRLKSVPKTVAVLALLQGGFILLGLSWSREGDQTLPLLLFLLLILGAFRAVQSTIRRLGIECYPKNRQTSRAGQED
jgi:UDP-GlcNAc:undecaprenyl-phosphate GlcNAc-1-phosphate transferase